MKRGNLEFHVKENAQVEKPQGGIPTEISGAEEPVVAMKDL